MDLIGHRERVAMPYNFSTNLLMATSTSDLIPSGGETRVVQAPARTRRCYLFEISEGCGVSWSPPTPLKVTEPKEVERDCEVCPGFWRPHPFRI